MKKFSVISVFLAILLLFSGCADYLGELADNMNKMNQQDALAGTEDKLMVNVFIKNIPNAMVSKNQIYTEQKLDLGNKSGSQTTNLNSWIYRPKEFFERNADKETLAYKTWVNTVKKRGDIINKYNAKIADKLSGYIYLNKLYSYESYYYKLTPTYIEYDHNGNMISAFMKVLKTEDLSGVGGYVVEGHHSYYAYEYDIIILRTTLRKIQMNTSKRFFDDNLLESNLSYSSDKIQKKTKQTITNTVPAKSITSNKNVSQINTRINQMIVDRFNSQHNTHFKTTQEIQKYLSKNKQ